MLNRPSYLYKYSGTVVIFGRDEDHFSGETYAVSEQKARANLCHQYRVKKGLKRATPVKLVHPIQKDESMVRYN